MSPWLLAVAGVVGAVLAWLVQRLRYKPAVEQAQRVDEAEEALKNERVVRVDSETVAARQLEFEWAEAQKEAARVEDPAVALALLVAARNRLRRASAEGTARTATLPPAGKARTP